MKNKINTFINVIIGSSIGIFIGTSIYKFLDYRSKLDLYDMQSMPWYTSIQLEFFGLLAVLGVCIAIKGILKNFNK